MRLTARRRLGSLAVLALPLGWTLLFMIVPYAIMLAYSFFRKEGFNFVPDLNLANYASLLKDPQYRQVLQRTLKISSAVSLSAMVLAYPLAYFIALKIRAQRLRLFLYMMVIVPLWVSYLLRAYIWKTILGSEGVLNSFLVWTGILSEPTPLLLYNQFSMVLTLTYIFIPFMFMPIYTALEKIPRSSHRGLLGSRRQSVADFPESDAAAVGPGSARGLYLYVLSVIRRLHCAVPRRWTDRHVGRERRAVAIRHRVQLAAGGCYIDGHTPGRHRDHFHR